MRPSPFLGGRGMIALRGGQAMVDKQHVKGAIDKIKGEVKDKLGAATGNRKLQAAGKLDKAKGVLRSVAGDAKDVLKGRR